jgi:hypothetical protein
MSEREAKMRARALIDDAEAVPAPADDLEIAALRRIRMVLEPLGIAARQRVIRWACARFVDDVVPSIVGRHIAL